MSATVPKRPKEGLQVWRVCPLCPSLLVKVEGWNDHWLYNHPDFFTNYLGEGVRVDVIGFTSNAPVKELTNCAKCGAVLERGKERDHEERDHPQHTNF